MGRVPTMTAAATNATEAQIRNCCRCCTNTPRIHFLATFEALWRTVRTLATCLPCDHPRTFNLASQCDDLSWSNHSSSAPRQRLQKRSCLRRQAGTARSFEHLGDCCLELRGRRLGRWRYAVRSREVLRILEDRQPVPVNAWARPVAANADRDGEVNGRRHRLQLYFLVQGSRRERHDAARIDLDFASLERQVARISQDAVTDAVARGDAVERRLLPGIERPALPPFKQRLTDIETNQLALLDVDLGRALERVHDLLFALPAP